MKRRSHHRVLHLPWELVIEILSWLPVKTLLRFRCVSTSWKSLISDDKSFAKLHLNRSLRNEHILLNLEFTPFFKDGFYPFPVTRLLDGGPPMIDDEWFRRLRNIFSVAVDGGDDCRRRRLMTMYSAIGDGWCYRLKSESEYEYSPIGSCNGLICLRGFTHETDPDESDPIEYMWIRLWNPATRSMSRNSPFCTFNTRCHTHFGFGAGRYDDSRDDDAYKVVVVVWDPEEQKLETWVYCMGDTCWRKILKPPAFPLRLEESDGQFVGGCLNWLALDKLSSHYLSWEEANVTLHPLVIVSFDMREEAYRFLSLPEGVSNEVPHVHSTLGVLRDRLCLFHDHNKTHFVVWQMREYGVRESWTRLVSVSYEHLQCHGFPQYPPLMCFCEDRDIVLFISDSWSGRDYLGLEVVMYNLRDNSVKCVIRLDNDVLWLFRNNYVRSLISPC